ncbi:MAG: alkaline phosphatase family protein [Candidatus Aminicenantes bacterium]|nr:alkaline phosphatase family protein [Candidatus Aminicenantes bacterium]
MAFFKRKKKKRVCVIGLDGVPYSLLLELAEKGIMPAISRLLDSGHLHRMKASLPEISAVSWTNFMTGANPGTHGIFGFTDLKKNSYELRFPNFLDLKKETFWDILGRHGKKCIIINQPSTYPAREINGVLISGFVAIELARAVYPPSCKAPLEQVGYQIDIDTLKSRENNEFLWKDLSKTLAGRQEAFNLFWQRDWDYFEFVITGTDRLHHFLWNAYEDESHVHHLKFLDYYRQIDDVIEKIVTAFRKLTDDDERLFLLSDHGFTGIEQEVYLNVWLKKEGYLEFANPAPQDLKEISPHSRAFVMDPNRIYLNLKEKFPQGCVGPLEKKVLKEQISQKLEKLEYNGKKVVRRVFDAEDVYSGPYLPEGPDLIVLSEYGFDMKGSVKKKEMFGRTNLQGMHTWDDAFFWAKKEQDKDLSISDLAGIILDKML